jgi:pentatricopeptide repeat protein
LRPTKDQFESCLNAWVKAATPTSGQRAELILLKMQELFEKQWDTKPSVQSFSKVVEAWANSRHPDATLRADAIVQIMHEMDWSKESAADMGLFAKSMADTYLQAMKLWSWSTDRKALERCAALLQQFDQSIGFGNIPLVKLQRMYAVLIATWAQSGRPDMVPQSEALLIELRMRQTSNETRPDWDYSIYHSMLQVYAKSGDGEKAETVFRYILFEYLQRNEAIGASPDSVGLDAKSLNSVLLAWSKSGDPMAALRAETLFLQVQDLRRSGRVILRLDVVTYNALLSALSGTTDEAMARRGMEYFRQMAQEATCRPTTNTYSKAILLWRNICSPEALETAQMLLDEMRFGESNFEPDAAAFTAFQSVLQSSTLSYSERRRRLQEIQLQMEKQQIVARPPSTKGQGGKR